MLEKKFHFKEKKFVAVIAEEDNCFAIEALKVRACIHKTSFFCNLRIGPIS
jgi:hypothetical protein